MSDAVLYDGHRLLITRRSGAVRLKLSWRPGRDYFTLSVPPGVTQREVHSFLRQHDDWMKLQEAKQANRWEPSLEAGERALLNGRMVTLGRDGIPCGQAFLKLRGQVLQQRVKALLPLWEERMSVHIQRVTLREMSSRWGSCTPAKAHMSLCLRLGAMSDELIEYVIVHELCHMHHPDHSAAFHDEMTRLMPDWPQRRQRLKTAEPLHFPPEEDKP